jgi:hypothetical protein
MKRIYLETSLAIEYFNYAGAEFREMEDERFKIPERPWTPYLKELLGQMKTEQFAHRIRDVVFGGVEADLVISPLVWIELVEWFAEETFKLWAVDTVGAKRAQRIGKKQAGEYLSRILGDSEQDPKSPASDIRNLTTFTAEFAQYDGLSGIDKYDLKDFAITGDDMQVAVGLAYSQMGLADILHVLVAKYLGCEFLATCDSDYNRLKDRIKTDVGVEVLYKDGVFKEL